MFATNLAFWERFSGLRSCILDVMKNPDIQLGIPSRLIDSMVNARSHYKVVVYTNTEDHNLNGIHQFQVNFIPPYSTWLSKLQRRLPTGKSSSKSVSLINFPQMSRTPVIFPHLSLISSSASFPMGRYNGHP